jgi:hypothetical protein
MISAKLQLQAAGKNISGGFFLLLQQNGGIFHKCKKLCGFYK